MSPRERAEALGWVEQAHGWFWRDEDGESRALAARVEWSDMGVVSWWSRPTHAPGEAFNTEDEALAHALLLRDVVLS